METQHILITGAARRIGAAIAKQLHQRGYSVILHYNRSDEAANTLCQELNQLRDNSANTIQADLSCHDAVLDLANTICKQYPTLKLLVNNASSFYPTPIDELNLSAWDDLINSNLRAALFLSSTLSKILASQSGAIVNITDATAMRNPNKNHVIYNIAKAGLAMLTRSLAKDLAPDVRVNAIAPGAILWPEGEAVLEESAKTAILDKTLLQRVGTPEEIAHAVCFLAENQFITGETITVDGGRF